MKTRRVKTETGLELYNPETDMLVDTLEYTTELIATHNGRITLHNPATGNHRTFQIRTIPEDSTFAPGKRVVELLTGPDNESNYRGFGFVDVRVGGFVEIHLWRKATEADANFKAFADMLLRPVAYAARGIEYLFEGRCRRCNRALTTPESIKRGIGPVCAIAERS